jgi:hypothetical protein
MELPDAGVPCPNEKVYVYVTTGALAFTEPLTYTLPDIVDDVMYVPYSAMFD